MPNLIIGNSVCQAKNLTLQEFAHLRDLLSYETSPTPNLFMNRYHSTKKYLIDKKGNFPTGLLYLVQGYFEGDALQVLDTRVLPAHSQNIFTIKLPHEPYDEQINASLAALQYGRGIIVAPTGLGKSSIIALIIATLQVKTLVVVPSLELKKQLTETLLGAFGSLNHITIENVDSVPIGDKTKYDLVILDEFHHAAAKTYRKLNERSWHNTYYKIGLTATPFRTQDNEQLLLESVLSQVIYEIPYKTAVARGYIVPMEAFYIDVPLTNIQGNQKSWPAMYSELVVNNKPRNELVSKLLLKLLMQQAASICLVKEIKHGDLIASDKFGFVSGQNDERYLIEAFNKGKLEVLIGTDGVLGEGVDTKPAEYIVLAGLGKSRPRFMQGCGRGFRVYPNKASCKIIIFRDLSHKWTRDHYKAQVKTLMEEYGTIPVKLEL